jgi:hypothetical protein
MTKRVAVFIDWQNCYHCAREAFHDPDTDPSYCGSIWPIKLAELLTSKGPSEDGRKLGFVGVYAGRPDPRKDPKTSAAHLRQCQTWQSLDDERLSLKTRSLRYPPNWPRQAAEEKGVDVQLAIDAMVMAARGEFDVAVVASADTDLLPVLEGVVALHLEVEVVGWAGLSRKLEIPGLEVPVRWVGKQDYAAIRDATDYNIRPGAAPRYRR